MFSGEVFAFFDGWFLLQNFIRPDERNFWLIWKIHQWGVEKQSPRWAMNILFTMNDNSTMKHNIANRTWTITII